MTTYKKGVENIKRTNLKIFRNVTALLLVLVVVASAFAVLPFTAAHDPALDIPTYCYVAITNSVIGINQKVTVVFWLNAVPPTAVGAYGDRWTFTVEVTKPDSSKETLGPFTSDPVGSGWAAYTPTQVGTYTIVAQFAEHKVIGTPSPPEGYFSGEDAYIGDTYSASDSDPITLTVQEEQIQPWPETPLPTQFWTRPINQANRNWYVLAGNWLAAPLQKVGPTIRFCYGEGPESAHIMWASQIWAGGLMDARFGETGFATGHYEGIDFVPPIILNGKVYYNVLSLPMEGWYCLDLYTGEVEYFHNTTGPVTGVSAGSSGAIVGEALSFGQIYNYDSPNQHGGMPYLWSTNGPTSGTWMMFDAYSGNYVCSINNVPYWATMSVDPINAQFYAGLVAVYGKDGSILSYNVVDYGTAEEPNYYLQCWNTSRAIWWKPSWPSNEYWEWRPGLNETYDGNNGYSLNMSIPDVQGIIQVVREDQYVIGGTSGKNNGTYIEEGCLWALSLVPGSEGTLLWNITFTPPQTAPDVAQGAYGMGAQSMSIVDPEDGVFLVKDTLVRQWWGYSLVTGQLLWGPTASEPQMQMYGMQSNVYNGKLLSCGYGGALMAYDIKTGEVLWNYMAAQVGFESPYGNYPTSITAIADGKIYLVTGEHSVTQPMWRGYLRCINASNGVELWKILHFGTDGGSSLEGQYVAMADGYAVGLDMYDAKIYCYGKGPSAVTVDAPMTAISRGESVVIRGTVTDVCAGAKQLVEEGKFSVVPAMSDADQQGWMEYVYKQQQKPANAIGVRVHLTAIDPNGNFQDIGIATSDDSGLFSIMWVPPVPGKYVVTASFEGSNAYYGSSAKTAFGVSEAAASVVVPTQQPAETASSIASSQTLIPAQSASPSPSEAPQPPTSSGMPTGTCIAIGAAVLVIVVAAAALIIRKRK